MHSVSTVEELRSTLDAWRGAGERIAFVPTMGNLHDGHLQLVRHARACGSRVVVSIFVNPAQFGPDEDFSSYPRTLGQDSEKLQQEDADLLFAPPVEVIYPGGVDQTTRVEVPGVSEGLEGEFRPGHFSGVATVVARLFNLVQPQLAIFGEKDFQQLAVIRRMVDDLCWPIRIEGVPTVREEDGLAMSSRNQYLSTTERERAPLLYRTLCDLAEKVRAAESDFAGLEKQAMRTLEQAGFRPEYVAIRGVRTLKPAIPGETDCVVLAAAGLGKARLIDNVRV